MSQLPSEPHVVLYVLDTLRHLGADQGHHRPGASPRSRPVPAHLLLARSGVEHPGRSPARTLHSRRVHSGPSRAPPGCGLEARRCDATPQRTGRPRGQSPPTAPLRRDRGAAARDPLHRGLAQRLRARCRTASTPSCPRSSPTAGAARRCGTSWPAGSCDTWWRSRMSSATGSVASPPNPRPP